MSVLRLVSSQISRPSTSLFAKANSREDLLPSPPVTSSPSPSSSVILSSSSSSSNCYEQLSAELKRNSITAEGGEAIDIRELFAAGDLLPEHHDIASTHPEAFVGRWTVMTHRSECLDEIYKCCGVGVFKRRIVSSFVPVCEIELLKNQAAKGAAKAAVVAPIFNLSINFTPHWKIGQVRKTGIVSCDGKETIEQDNDTGVWCVRSCFVNGRVITRRESEKGLFYDTRAIFPTDPLQEVEGPVKIFRGTFIEKRTGKAAYCTRWYSKS